MTRERITLGLVWVLVGWTLLGELLFGAMGLRLGRDSSAPLLETRFLFYGVALAAAGVGLLLMPRDRRPSRGWCLAALALPAMLFVQQLPLPVPLIDWFSPARVALLTETWPGPQIGCDGSTLVAAEIPAWSTFSVDPASTRRFLAQTLATLLVFLLARSALADRPHARRTLLLAVAGFASAEAAYGIVQWASETPMALWRERTAVLDAATGTLINRNHFAMLLYLGLACSLSLLAGRRSGETGERQTAVRATAGLFVGLQLAGILASQSRAGILLAGALVLATLPLILRVKPVARLLTVVMLLAVAVPAALLIGPALVERLVSLPIEWTSPAGRGAVLRHSLELVGAYPLSGTGGGSFEWIFSTVRGPAIQGRYTFAHNDYLQLLVECGVVGLVLAMLPVSIYALEVWRAYRGGTRFLSGLASWPLRFGLVAVAVHELVDFGLQIPAHTLLFALLAAAAATPRRAAPRTSRWAVAAAIAALLVAPIAVTMDLAQWPGLRGRVPAAGIPEALHDLQRDSFDRWRGDESDTEALCSSLGYAAETSAARPLSARIVSDLARVASLTLLTGAVTDDARRARIEEQALRATDLARRVDPWNSFVRARLMGISLTFGALDLAMADARAVVAVSPHQSREVVKALRDAGLDARHIAALVAEQPAALKTLLASLIRDGELDVAGQLIPPDVRAEPELCGVASDVAAILVRAHGVSVEPFLRGCLELPGVRGDADATGPLRVVLAAHLIIEGRNDDARALVEQLGPGPMRDRIAYRLAVADRRWEDVIPLARSLIGLARDSGDAYGEVDLRMRLAQAYEETGRAGLALREYERVEAIEPDHPLLEERLRRLRRGR